MGKENYWEKENQGKRSRASCLQEKEGGESVPSSGAPDSAERTQ